MIEFIQQLINGLAQGSIYALIALGYTMVYGVLRFINFAHGDVYMVGAFAGMYDATGHQQRILALHIAIPAVMKLFPEKYALAGGFCVLITREGGTIVPSHSY